MGILTKTRKTRLSIVKRFFTKQHYPWGKVQKFGGRLSVKVCLYTKQILSCVFHLWCMFQTECLILCEKILDLKKSREEVEKKRGSWL